MKTTIVILLTVALTTSAFAATWFVAPDGTGDTATIQAAIDLAAPGDIIELADGVFTGPGNRDLDYLGKPITVRSQGGDASACIIDCEGSSDDPHRGVWFHTAETADARLENLTITGGDMEAEAPLPGGVGGAILISHDAAPTLTGVVLRENRAMSGGAMGIWSAAPTIENCQFLDNHGWWGSGGAVALYYAVIPTPIVDCVFRRNASIQAGGGISSAQSEFALERCIFEENTLTNGSGGGLECYSETVCQVTDCTFVRNSSGHGGGTAIKWNSEVVIRRCTFSENSASNSSGVYVDDSEVRLAQSILAFGQGASVELGNSGTLTVECCDIYGNEGGDWVDDIADQADQAHNRSVDPLFCGDAQPDQPYSLQSASTCAPGVYPCIQIGAWPVGCTVMAVNEATPDAGMLTLHGAVPSPFNPRTSITFSLKQSGPVELAIYDARGRRITVLTDGVQPVGSTTVSWDGRDQAGRDVPSGTYLVVARSGSEMDVSKAVLIR